MTLLLCLALVACGSPSADDDDDDTTGVPLGDSTELVDTASDTEDTGYECNPWYPCQDCGGGACSSEISACVADSTCQSALNRWAECVLDCERPSDCADTFAQSGAPAASLRECVTAGCAEECDL